MCGKLSSVRGGGLIKSRARNLALAAAALLAFSGPAAAIGPVVRIEQDWEITISSPDSLNGSPQIRLWIRPDPAVDFGGLVQINFQDYPAYQAGGLQVQAWDGDNTPGVKSATPVKLSTKS